MTSEVKLIYVENGLYVENGWFMMTTFCIFLDPRVRTGPGISRPKNSWVPIFSYKKPVPKKGENNNKINKKGETLV